MGGASEGRGGEQLTVVWVLPVVLPVRGGVRGTKDIQEFNKKYFLNRTRH